MAYLKFTVDSALLRELGEKLVETVHLALVELVKNCYDADATNVEIIFETDGKGKSQIRVVDDGVGMSYKAVKDYWMRIATTNKVEKNVSTVFGRPLTGAKGIGRFCCRRLGGHLTLISHGTRHGKSVGIQPAVELTKVEFPWTDFVPGSDVTDIKCKGDNRVIKRKATGTTLVISNIEDEWNARGLNWLKRQLAVLAANRGAKRNGFKHDPGFSVKLIAPDFEGGIRDLREDFINAGWATLTASINKKHHAVCELNALGLGRKTIISKMPFPALQDVSLTLGIMVDNRVQMRDTSISSIGTLQQILPDWGGVQVRYKGFRVFPYGDDDWLDIDHDRGLRKGAPKDELLQFAETLRGVDASRSLLNMLSMRSYVGNVEIGDKAKGFEMKLNREGFVETESVIQLKEFVRFAIDWSTVLRDYYLRQQSQYDSFLAKTEFENVINEKIEFGSIVDSAVNYLEREVVNIAQTLPEDERRAVEITFLKATDAIRKHNISNRLELAHLRVVASTSTLLLIFSHEVKSLLGVLEQSKNTLLDISKSLSPKQQKIVEDVTDSFIDLKDRLDELLELTSLVGTDQRKAKVGQVSIKEKVEKVAKVFDLIVNKYEIIIKYDGIPINLAVKSMLEAELYSILLNIMSNSIKSIIAGGKNRLIEISAKRENGMNIINVRDTGLALPTERFEEVFIPFISDPEGKLYDNLEKRLNPEDKLIIGSGSGLGLGIVKEIVESHEGYVRFVSPQEGWSTEIEIGLP